MADTSLAGCLRRRTAGLHARTEQVIGLPKSIRNRDEYLACLCRLHALYVPLERCLAGFSEWRDIGIALPSPSHAENLAADIAVLGADPDTIKPAPPAMLPRLPEFAHALGALYVLEGATLGGRLILRDLEERLGTTIVCATLFLGGRGAAVGPTWQRFRRGLETFAAQRPSECGRVIDGAETTFRAVLAWFTPVGDANPAPPEAVAP